MSLGCFHQKLDFFKFVGTRRFHLVHFISSSVCQKWSLQSLLHRNEVSVPDPVNATKTSVKHDRVWKMGETAARPGSRRDNHKWRQGFVHLWAVAVLCPSPRIRNSTFAGGWLLSHLSYHRSWYRRSVYLSSVPDHVGHGLLLHFRLRRSLSVLWMHFAR